MINYESRLIVDITIQNNDTWIVSRLKIGIAITVTTRRRLT
jgi:hypothetical protein